VSHGQILWGSNNIFYVQEGGTGSGGSVLECRIKGKKLDVGGEEYNPLAPGDFVDFEPESAKRGMILARGERDCVIQRWNKKRNAPQILACNIDLAVVVTCVESPPFRPRFLDRCLIAAHPGGIPVLIAVNKVDLGISDEDGERILHYRRLGYEICLTSTALGEGIDELRQRLDGKLVAFIGQSGVGKSSLLQALDPSLDARVGYISAKYNRGTHTTVLAKTYLVPFARGIVDTPGIRQLELTDMSPRDIALSFPDFEPYHGQCGLYNCLHQTEPDCAVLKAVEDGRILADRYESYCRILSGQGD
jgi:ribosome biogenesis GTPase